MVYSSYKQQRIIRYLRLGFKSSTIAAFLLREGLQVSVSGVAYFIKKYKATASISRKPGSGRPTKITLEILSIVEQQMQDDDETTAVQLQKLLEDRGFPLSLKTILSSRRKLGWTFRGSAHCQLIRDVNKVKRLEWAKANEENARTNNFKRVVWTDECSVQLETLRRFSFRKEGCQPKPKPRPKHPAKVHVWAGISWQGPTPIVAFEDKMNATGYIEVLTSGLVPFVRDIDSNPKFMQDNDPKHTLHVVGKWLSASGIEWWKTPPESPDLNPIENLWHRLKEFLRREVKPRTKDELIGGILKFWETVDVAKCQK